MNFLIALLILNVMVIAHELGHFIFARINGIDVDEFAIGFGPTLFQKKWKGTNWAIKLFPLGGYNGLKGEEEEVAGPGNFVTATKKAKLQVLFAGSFMNIVMAILSFYIALGLTGWKTPVPMDFNPIGGEVVPMDPAYPVVVGVAEDGPASKLEVQPPYYVVSIDDKPTRSADDVVNEIADSGDSVNFLIQTLKGENYSYKIEKDPEGKIGIIIDNPGLQISYADNFSTKIFSGVSHTVNMITLSGKVIGTMVRYSIETKDAEPLGYVFSGPVAVVAAVDAVVENSNTVIADLANMTGLIGVSLAIFNLLPFPGLDGWHIVLVLFEKIFKRKPNQKIVGRLTALGLLLLFALGFIVIVKDYFIFFRK